jgi:RNA polymerase sigma factor (sigma-70 family)
MMTMVPIERLPHEREDTNASAHAPPGFLAWVGQLVHVHRQRLLAYARRRGLDAEESLDAVQDSFISFLRLPEARSMAQGGDDALELLTVILRHNLQNHRRKRSRRDRARTTLEVVAVDAGVEDSETIIARAEELARVHGCILRMARLQRQVVLLSLLDDQPREHIAETLGISGEYLRVLRHRAREHVRNCSFIYDDERAEVE